MHLKSSRNIVTILLLLGICHSVYLIRPSALLKRAFLRSRLMALPTFAVNGTMRLKRQLFREDIPHSRPLTGNTYYLHAGFPHPSRWHEGPQIIGPNPNPITHHHLQHHQRPGLHDDLHNNHLNSHHHDHHGHHENQLLHPHDPPKVQLVHTEEPHTVTIQSAIVHGGGDFGGGIIDNSLGHHHPSPAPYHPHHHQQHHEHHDQFNHIHPPNPGHIRPNILRHRPKHPKPHSEPEPFGEDIDAGHYGLRDIGHDHGHGPIGSPAPPFQTPKSIPVHIVQNQPPRKPKTIIHYHPVTVGNIININDDGQKSLAYGPPKHVPGEPIGHSHHPPPPPHHHHHPHPHKDVMLSMAEPFIKTPFKSVNGPPDFLDFGNKEPISYGPPDHSPGHPLSAHDLAPMLPSYGPPVKEEPISPYNVALPVLAHLHSTDHHHHHHHHPPPPPPPPRKRHRGGRHHHHHRGPPRRHHLHFHHIHHDHPPHPPPPPHPPGALGSPFFQPTYVVHGHVPSKFVSLHSPHFKSHAVSHHHHRRAWAL